MIAVVTGGNQGLGLDISARLARRGHTVVILRGEQLNGKDRIRHDIRDLVIGRPEYRYGERLLVVNNYGINHLSWIGTTPHSDEEILRMNVMVPYWVVDALVSLGETANVLNVASQTYRVPQRCTSLYAASKAALVQMTRVMARELAPKGWRVNAMAPGKIEGTLMTELTDRQVGELRNWSREEADRYALGMIPMGRFTTTDEVAKCAETILLDLPEYVNGAVIDVMGGV